MTDTTTKRHSRTQMARMKELANPDAYTLAFAWLAGVGDANKEIGERVDDAIDYVEEVYGND